jgi:hypothetical protein
MITNNIYIYVTSKFYITQKIDGHWPAMIYFNFNFLKFHSRDFIPHMSHPTYEWTEWLDISTLCKDCCCG